MDKKIFLIDDIQFNRVLFEEKYGDNVYTLESFKDADFRISDFEPDVIIISYDLISDLSSQEIAFLKDTQIPVAVFGGTGEQIEGLDISAFIPKPIEMERLEEILQGIG